MRIVEIAPWEEPVPPRRYGGTERVVHSVTEGLARRGHDVYLIAAADSTTSAHLVPVAPASFREMFPADKHSPQEIEELRNYWRIARVAQAMGTALDLAPDIVHNHVSWRAVLLAKFLHCPMLTTCHGPLNVFRELETFAAHPEGNYVSISDNQRKALPGANWIATVRNGIEVASYPMGAGDGGYFAFLGRANPEKGLLEICKLIKGSPYRLKIAAKVDSVDVEYFETNVRPYVDGDQIEYVGEVDDEEKRELLAGATALLLWLNWEEPFGLVVAEAAACGTPVIASRRGSMPELIEDGVTGFLVASVEEMRGRLKDAKTLSRAACRARAEAEFDVERMVDEYERIMERLAHGG